MRILLSAWVVPVSSPPIRIGAVAVEAEEIVAIGPAEEILARYGDRATIVDLGDAVLMPAFVNAHTHLELAWMKGERLARGDFMTWLRGMIGRRAATTAEIEAGIDRGIAELAAGGTALVGDVGNRPSSPSRLQAAGMGGRFFLELLAERPGGPGLAFDDACRILDETEHPSPAPPSAGELRERNRLGRSSREDLFPGMSGDSADPTRHPRRPEHDSLSDREIHAEATGHAAALAPLPPLLASVVPHGPHSVPRSLLRRIAERACARGDIISVHAAESAAEVEFVRRGTGPFRELLEQIEPLAPGWRPPGLSPIEVLDEAGLLGPRTLAVHCVHVTREDARILAARGATVVLCPRSNAAIGAGAAPVGMLASEGLRLALGTDSLASNDDLDIVSEMAALRALAPALASEAIVRAATLGGAEALGLASRFGSIEAGKRAALVYLRRRDGIAVGSDPFETIFAVPRTVTVTPVR